MRSDVCPNATGCPVYIHYVELNDKNINNVDVIRGGHDGAPHHCLAIDYVTTDGESMEKVWDHTKGRVFGSDKELGCAWIKLLNMGVGLE